MLGSLFFVAASFLCSIMIRPASAATRLWFSAFAVPGTDATFDYIGDFSSMTKKT
jgi:hypothetical protein